MPATPTGRCSTGFGRSRSTPTGTCTRRTTCSSRARSRSRSSAMMLRRRTVDASRTATRNLALATLAFAVAFSRLEPDRPSGEAVPGRSRSLEHPHADAHRGAGRARLAAENPCRCADRPDRRAGDVPGGARSCRRSRRRSSASSTAIRRSSSSGSSSASPARRSPSASRSWPAGTPRSGRGSRSACTGWETSGPPSRPSARLRSSTGSAARRSGSSPRRCCWSTAAGLLRDGRGPAARACVALRRGTPLGLEAVAARAAILRHVRRLRRDGGVPAEAAPRLVRHLADERRATGRWLHGRRDVCPARRRLPVRPDRLGHGADRRLHRRRRRCHVAGLHLRATRRRSR